MSLALFAEKRRNQSRSWLRPLNSSKSGGDLEAVKDRDQSRLLRRPGEMRWNDGVVFAAEFARSEIRTGPI